MWDFPARLASKAIDELWERLWVAQQGPFQRSPFATIKELIRRLPSPPTPSRSTRIWRFPLISTANLWRTLAGGVWLNQEVFDRKPQTIRLFQIDLPCLG